MKILIISNEFYPINSSGSIQIHDLANELIIQKHSVDILTSAQSSSTDHQFYPIKVMRPFAFNAKDINFVLRGINEFLNMILMYFFIRFTKIRTMKWDLVVWYSPTIFLGIIANQLKKQSSSNGYLILRDIFPDWAIDMGLIKDPFSKLIFNFFANLQYRIADKIGVQSNGNFDYLSKRIDPTKIEILHNWLSDVKCTEPSKELLVLKKNLQSSTVLVYAGNMGVAQDLHLFINLAKHLQNISELRFLFVGRGSQRDALMRFSQKLGLENIIFHDQLAPTDIPHLYKFCDIGILSLHHKHKTHNIPGKFLSYMLSELPVLASVNPDNDIYNIINQNNVGLASTGDLYRLIQDAKSLLEIVRSDESSLQIMKTQCASLYNKLFSPKNAVRQIVSSSKA